MVNDPDLRYQNWSNFAWNLFKAAIQVTIYNLCELEIVKMGRRCKLLSNRMNSCLPKFPKIDLQYLWSFGLEAKVINMEAAHAKNKQLKTNLSHVKGKRSKEYFIKLILRK